MKLYEVPRNTKVRIIDDETTTPVISYPVNKQEILYYHHYHHTDGMYSYCINEEGVVVHPAAWTNVEIVK